MREIVDRIKDENLTTAEIQALNINLNNLAVQVKVIDIESRRGKDIRIMSISSYRNSY